MRVAGTILHVELLLAALLIFGWVWLTGCATAAAQCDPGTGAITVATNAVARVQHVVVASDAPLAPEAPAEAEGLETDELTPEFTAMADAYAARHPEPTPGEPGATVAAPPGGTPVRCYVSIDAKPASGWLESAIEGAALWLGFGAVP